MTKRLLNILSIALIYCGAVFGAGFASGREIFSFFSCYKMWGIIASFVSSFLFSFFGYHICRFSKEKNIENIGQYLKELFPKRAVGIFSFVTNGFLGLSFCIMITGCGTLFFEQFNIPVVTASLFSLVVCFVVIKNRVSGLEKFNFFATPFMIIGVVALCVLSAKLSVNSPILQEEIIVPIVSGVLYVSYNMISATAVLITSSKIAKNGRDAGFGGALGGMLIGIPLTLMSVVLALHWEVASYPMPFFALVHNNFPGLGVVCSIVLYLAMMTTAVSSGVSLIGNVGEKESGKHTLMLCVAAFLISFMPFAQLVLTVYSAFGVIGIVLIGAIFIKILENARNEHKNKR